MGDWGWELSGFGKTRTQQTRNLLDERVGGDEGVILASQLLDQLLVLVELLQVIGGHGVDTTVLGSVDIVLVTENAGYPLVLLSSLARFVGNIPDGHVWARDNWELDGARETLVTLRVIVLQADLELDGLLRFVLAMRCLRPDVAVSDSYLEEVPLLGFVGVLKELLDVSTHTGDCDFGHLDSLPEEILGFFW